MGDWPRARGSAARSVPPRTLPLPLRTICCLSARFCCRVESYIRRPSAGPLTDCVRYRASILQASSPPPGGLKDSARIELGSRLG
jgi:hypothetical protein